jgi:hypothetical protein
MARGRLDHRPRPRRGRRRRPRHLRGHACRSRRRPLHPYFQSAQKFKSRYATVGLSDEADLDKDAIWPTSFALKDLTAAEEAKIAALVNKAES